MVSFKRLAMAGLLLVALLVSSLAAQSDPLPSWNDGPAKQSIIDFVVRVTKSGDAEYVPEARRVAVFDNDGTLWAEQPIYFQVA
ncbi:MAG TPA: haloacid dehalogenase-like hydrolase, partial [Hyphomicrobium sp.]|nr:haloacid dehalogenase-like hydrolase [Hyphomicrobium sp.]